MSKEKEGRVCIEVSEENLFSFDLQHNNMIYEDVINVFVLLESAMISHYFKDYAKVKVFDSFDIFELENDPKKVCIAFNNDTKEIQVSITNLNPWEVGKLSGFLVQYLRGKIIDYGATNNN